MPKANPSTDTQTSPTNSRKLTQEDVIRLLNPEQTAEARLDVTDKLASNYESATMTAEEMLIAEQIFRLLVRDTELDIRKKLAEHLKASEKIPRDIALTMANDVTEVALPVLEYSRVLTDLDLADIIKATSDTTRHIAIAKRSQVSQSVVNVLLEYADGADVAQTLVSNKGATLNQENIKLLAQRHEGVPQVMDILAAHPNVPANIREKIISHVSDQIETALSEQHNIAKDIVQQEAAHSHKQATLELINNDLDEQDMRKLVEQLMMFDRLTPSLLLSVVLYGYINFYVIAMSVLANIPLENTIKLLSDSGGLGFRALYNKCDLTTEHYNVLRDITPIAIELKDEMSGLEGEGFTKLLAKRVTAQFDEIEKPYDHITAAINAVME